MAEIFQIGEQKYRPGVYFRREAGDITPVAATYSTVAAVFSSNFGSFDVQTITIHEYNDLKQYYGPSQVKFLSQIFLGGAQQVRCVRIGKNDTNATNSSITLKNADNTAIATVSCKYPGARTFEVTIRDNLISGKRQILFTENGVIFEQAEFTEYENEPLQLATALKNSKNFTVTRLAAGKFANIDQVSMTAGTNPQITAAAYSAAMSQLDGYRWNVIVADRDNSIVAPLLYNYVRYAYETGHFGLAVIGSDYQTAFSERIAYAKSINSELCVMTLGGWKDASGGVYNEAIAAARIAGMIAGNETNTSIAHLTIQSAASLLEELTTAQLIEAVQSGCVAFSLNDEDQVIIDSAVTTLTTPGNNVDDGWKKIRRVRTRFELLERVNRTCDKLVARINNDDNGRATVQAAIQGIIDQMVAENKLFSGSYVTLDNRYTPVGDSAWFLLVIGDTDSLEKIYLTYRFSYSNPFTNAG